MKARSLGLLAGGALLPALVVGGLGLVVVKAPGCGGAALAPPAPGLAEVSATLASRRVDAGAAVELTVRSRLAEGWTVALAPPQAEGLTATQTQQSGPMPQGDRSLTETTWRLEGPDGSYVVVPAAGVATGPGGEERAVEVAPLFVDIGVDGPTAQGLAEFEAPPPPSETPWAALAVAALAGGALGAASTAWLLWGRSPPPPPPPVPPETAARRAWAQAKSADLDDHGLALALSRILRVFYQDITGWPATARTTREITHHMQERGLLGAEVRLRAARVLDATDRLKFAREGGGAGFFEPLEADFEAVLDAARLRPLGGVGPDGEASE